MTLAPGSRNGNKENGVIPVLASWLWWSGGAIVAIVVAAIVVKIFLAPSPQYISEVRQGYHKIQRGAFENVTAGGIAHSPFDEQALQREGRLFVTSKNIAVFYTIVEQDGDYIHQITALDKGPKASERVTFNFIMLMMNHVIDTLRIVPGGLCGQLTVEGTGEHSHSILMPLSAKAHETLRARKMG